MDNDHPEYRRTVDADYDEQDDTPETDGDGYQDTLKGSAAAPGDANRRVRGVPALRSR